MLESYQPVRLDVNAAIEKAKARPGFVAAWDAREEQYSILASLMVARTTAGITQQ